MIAVSIGRKGLDETKIQNVEAIAKHLNSKSIKNGCQISHFYVIFFTHTQQMSMSVHKVEMFPKIKLITFDFWPNVCEFYDRIAASLILNRRNANFTVLDCVAIVKLNRKIYAILNLARIWLQETVCLLSDIFKICFSISR